jgi:poly-gamma-glutamate capsule biosynthesis protein CapA/YwtB (metallophosphatase superfamily)
MVRSPRRLAAALLGCCLVADVAAASWALGFGAHAPASSPSVQSPTTTATGVGGAAGATGTTATTGAEGPTAAAVTSAPPDRITLAFAGDVHFERAARDLLVDAEPLTAALRDTIGRADFAMVNLETALGEGGAPLPGKAYAFRAPVSSLDTLARAGVDSVSMANNHAADFGAGVFAQTLAARRGAPIPIVGVGRDATEAFTPLRIDVHGVSVAVLASSQLREETSRDHAAGPGDPGIATNLDPAPLRRAVRAAAATSDLVVVMMHWGTQYTSCADERQRETARLLAADGADVIVGGHAHRPQGSGWLGQSYVAYGLSNFVWYNNEGAGAQTGVLTVTVDAAAARAEQARTGRKRPLVLGGQWSPMFIGADGVPRSPTSAPARDRLAAAWTEATRCAGLSGVVGGPTYG